MAGTNRGTMFGPGIYMADAVRATVAAEAATSCSHRFPQFFHQQLHIL